jgi:ParB family transcriptional regulator, chromosome partitioning protein
MARLFAFKPVGESAGPIKGASMSQVQELRQLPLEQIVPSHAQPRRCFDEAALQALADSLSVRGVLQPVLVRPLRDGMYGLLAGERRWRAAKLAGLESIPALVRAREDAEALETALIENMAREDLNPVAEARACVTLTEEFGLTCWQIAERVGHHKSVVSNLMRLPKLSEEILELLERGELSASHGIALLMADDPQVRPQLARAAVKEEWSVLELGRRVRAANTDVLAPGCSEEQRPNRRQARDLAALDVARAWGELLGAEVHVRVLPRGQMRIEVVFDSAAEGIALAERLAAALARGSKGRS